MELLNVYAITSDGTKVEASANTVGAVPQGQIATKDKAGLFKVGEAKYKFVKYVTSTDGSNIYNLYVWVNDNNYQYDTDRYVWSNGIKAEMVSATDDTGMVTNCVCAIEDYNGNKCVKITYTFEGTVQTGYVDNYTGEVDSKTWVQVDDKGQAYVETQSVNVATNWSTGIVQPSSDSFDIDDSGLMTLQVADNDTRGGIKVEPKDVSGAKELTLIQFGSGDGYTCLMVFPKLDVEQVQSGLQINSTSYGDTTIDSQYETSDFSCIFLGGVRKTVSKWWFSGEGTEQTIVWEDWENGTQYKLSDYSITSVQHVKAYRLYRFAAYNPTDSVTYYLDILAGLDQETCASDQEISDYVCKVDTDKGQGDGTYQYYLFCDGNYHPNIWQYTKGAQISSFDTSWLCRFGNTQEGLITGDHLTVIEDCFNSSGDYLIKDDTVSGGGYRFYFQNITSGLGMFSPVYMDTNVHDYADYAKYARGFAGTITENRVVLNDKEQPIVDVDHLNITQKVQTIIDNYHTSRVASTTQLGHTMAGTNTDGYKVSDLTYTEITGDNVAQYVGTVVDNGNTYTITVKNKVKHESVTSLGYKFTNNDQSTWTTVLSDIGIPTIQFEQVDDYYVLRVVITSSVTSTTYTLGTVVVDDGTRRYVDVDDSGVMSYLIPPVEIKEYDTATNENLGLVKFGTGFYKFELHHHDDKEAYYNKTPLIAYCNIETSKFTSKTYPTTGRTIIGFYNKPYVDTGSFTFVTSGYLAVSAEVFDFGYSDETLYGIKISYSDGTALMGEAYLSALASPAFDFNSFPVVNNGFDQMQVWIGTASIDNKGIVKSKEADPVGDTYYVKVDSDGTMNVTVPNPEATDTTLGTVQYGNNGYKYYAYVTDETTSVVNQVKVAEITTNVKASSFDTTSKEPSWTNVNPTFTWHSIDNSLGYQVTDVTKTQSGTSSIKVYKITASCVNASISGTTLTATLVATGNEECTYGMVNKSSETGQMMTDMTFLPDFIVAEMKKHTESWTFTLEDDSTITHNVVVLDD